MSQSTPATAARRAATRRFYDTVAESYAHLLPDTRVEAPLDLGMLAQFAAVLPASDGPVLDAGCGTGRMLTHLGSLGVSTFIGVDLSPAMVRQARVSHPGIPVSVAELADLPFPDATMRGVLCWYAIIHSSPDEVAIILGEARRVLMTGGALLLGFQAGTGERRIGRAYGHDVEISAVLHDTKEIARAVESAGFHLVATAERAAANGEKHAQGFVLARRR